MLQMTGDTRSAAEKKIEEIQNLTRQCSGLTIDEVEYLIRRIRKLETALRGTLTIISESSILMRQHEQELIYNADLLENP